METVLRSIPARARPGTGGPALRRAGALLFFTALSLAPIRFAGSPPAEAALKAYDLKFQTTGQSMWSAGPQSVLTYNQPWGASWNQSASGGSGFHDITLPQVCVPIPNPLPFGPTQACTPAVDLGTFGAEATAETDGTVAIEPHLTLKGGDVTIVYPIQVTIGLPPDGTLYPGDPFTISTWYVPDAGAVMLTDSPKVQAKVDALLNAHFKSSATVQGGSALGTKSGSLFDFSIGSPNPMPIFDSNLSNAFQQTIKNDVNFGFSDALGQATHGIVGGSFNQLALNTNGGLGQNSNLLSSGGQANFLNVQVDYTCAALTAADLPCPEQSFGLDLGPEGNFNANCQILDLYQNQEYDLSQQFQFDPHPKFHLFITGIGELDGSVGDTFSLTYPVPSADATSNNVRIGPVFLMDGQFSNTTDLEFHPTINATPLDVSYSGSVAGQDLGSFHLAPLTTASLTFPPSTQPLPLFEKTFPLQGFNSIAGDITGIRGYVYPKPALENIYPAVTKPGATLHFTASGQNFVQYHTNQKISLPSTTAAWNGDSRASTLDSSTGLLSFDITSSQANQEGIFKVTVANPSPGGGTSNAKSVIIDGTPPTTVFTPSGLQIPTNNGWHRGAVTATLTAQDQVSGVAEVDYQVDGHAMRAINHGPAVAGLFQTPPFTISGDGIHTVTYMSIDNAGNVEAVQSKQIMIDGTPPTIIGSRLPATGNAFGWNNSPVTVHFSCSDATSGVASCPSDTILKGEGAHQSVTGSSTDNAGNVASATVGGINIDLTPPTIRYNGNAGTYSLDQQVNITCSATDNLSGIQSDTCKNITGPAYSFAPGVNNFSATATDKAGNVGNGSTSFTVQVTFDSLCGLVEQFETKHGVAHSLCAKLQNAASAAAGGDQNAKSGIMGAFINEVQAQSGKSMTAEHAAILTKLAMAL